MNGNNLNRVQFSCAFPPIDLREAKFNGMGGGGQFYLSNYMETELLTHSVVSG